MKTFFVHMPPSYPEEIAAANVLTTIRYPDEYTEADMTFTREQWSNYLGRNLKYNEDNEIISGYRYEDNDFVEAMKGLKIFGYCAAAADAHRCLKAFKNLAEQIYEPEVVSRAMKNVTLMAYALMPLEEKTDYQGIYFMSNDINDLSNPEHVMMTNFPELYPQIRISKADLQIADSKITETAAGDFIIVSPMPESSIQMDKNGRLVDKLKDKNSRPARLTLDMSLPAAKSAANPRKKNGATDIGCKTAPRPIWEALTISCSKPCSIMSWQAKPVPISSAKRPPATRTTFLHLPLPMLTAGN